jgi:hypothetical protein
MTRSTILLSVLVALGTSGCDQFTDPDETDSERIVGAWSASSANVRVEGVPFGIPVSDLANAGDEQTFTFRTDGTFAFRFDPADGRRVTISYQGTEYVSFPLDRTVNLSGTYTVNESADEITFSTIAGQTADDFEMGYGFGLTGANLELIAEDPQTLARLFGIADADAAQVAEVVTGGSITYSQDT